MRAAMTVLEMSTFLDDVFPQQKGDLSIEHMDGDTVTIRLLTDHRHLRPGGTISGPTMFMLVDITAYIATMAPIGLEALSVTTSCSIDFMRKPEAGKDLVAKGVLLKLGKALAVVDVMVYSDGKDAPVARASLTYSIPPKRSV